MTGDATAPAGGAAGIRLPIAGVFSRFRGAEPGRIHAAAHSHHPWPDVSFEAHRQAWLDAAALQDQKWDRVLGEVVPEAQRHVAGRLGLPDPSTVVFGPNTHGLVMRVLSCLEPPVRILTTDAEFHSFERQARRLEEAGAATVTRIPARPFDGFHDRMSAAAAEGGHDLVYLSHVHFDSGFVHADWPEVVAAVPDDDTFVVVDGYHAFMALPVDLGAMADRVFYTAGGYKYAMAGEGACFLHAPPGYGPRPVDTGWYAGFGDLEEAPGGGTVGYRSDAGRFWGATFDPSGLYRFNAVQRLLDGFGITPAGIHGYVRGLQEQFLDLLDDAGIDDLGRATLLPPPATVTDRGNFLTFQTPRAAALQGALQDAEVVTDVRGDRLRLGFGVYHRERDIDELAARTARVAAGSA